MSKSDKKPTKNKEKSPWYRDGLAFECTQCGECCSGEPGFVWVNDEEISAMANELAMTVEEFEEHYTRQVGRDRSLTEFDNGDCVLLDPETRKCNVYESRPIQCRTWPFWDSTLDKKKSWKETCEVCPGAGKGRIYTLEEIETQRIKKSV